MSRNLGKLYCAFCQGRVVLEEKPRPIRADEAGAYFPGYRGQPFANAHCVACEAPYLGWCRLVPDHGLGRVSDPLGDWGDLSHRHSFNDEPAPEDCPRYRIARTTVTKTWLGETAVTHVVREPVDGTEWWAGYAKRNA